MAHTRKTKNFNPHSCPVTHCLNLIGGKWKILIMYGITKNCNRFSLLKKAIPTISKQTLVNLLHELEADKIVERIVYPETPPKVEYKITAFGLSLMPVIETMQNWGLKELNAERQ